MTTAEAAISPLTQAALYGNGIFTTITICEGKTFLWEKHWRRLICNAERVGIDLSAHAEEVTRKTLDKVLERNEVGEGRVRLTFYDASSSKFWPSHAEQKTSLLITTADRRPVPDIFRLTISPYSFTSRSPLAGVKSCNYLDRSLALDEAKAREFDEAIQLNERGEITSATMANVFWSKDNTLYTPSLKTGCLPGTTREFILENLECREVEESIETLEHADVLFLTSAGLGVVQVREFQSRQFEKTEHPILQLIKSQKYTKPHEEHS